MQVVEKDDMWIEQKRATGAKLAARAHRWPDSGLCLVCGSLAAPGWIAALRMSSTFIVHNKVKCRLLPCTL